jgi:hypothetical protein
MASSAQVVQIVNPPAARTSGVPVGMVVGQVSQRTSNTARRTVMIRPGVGPSVT